MSRTLRFSGFEIHRTVFPVAAGTILLFVLFSALNTEAVGSTFDGIQSWIVARFGWLYVLTLTGLLVFALWLCMSRYGTIRLGPDDEKPEFSTLTWFAMLFSAGMGIGLLFWSVAEPLYHFNSPPIGEPGTSEAARRAMGITPFHWGLHPWALYAVVAMALAYFGFRRGLPLSFRSVFYPLIGDRIHGWIGDAIDILACVATLFGVATSLGLGAMQVNAGANFLLGIPINTTVQVVLIGGITVLATISVVSGLHVGIRRLSEVNMAMMLLLFLLVFIGGPTFFLMRGLVENLGSYLQYLPQNSFWTATFEDESGKSWLGSWTVFYWGWWIAWSPFVGMFIARISRGRTIREFVVGVLAVPTLVGLAWLTIFGNSALHQSLFPERYEQTVYSVQVMDDVTGLPFAEDGERIIAPGRVPLHRDAEGALRGPDDQVVKLADGRAVTLDDQLYTIPAQQRFRGQFAAQSIPLTVAEYLQQPVLNESHTRPLDRVSTVMFAMFAQLPLAALLAFIATLGVILFFVTSSDSASLVIDIISSGGNQDPPVMTRIFWAVSEGVVAAILLLAGAASDVPRGALLALQTASITAALPFCIVIIAMCFSLGRGLRNEFAGDIPASHRRAIQLSRESAPSGETGATTSQRAGDPQTTVDRDDGS